MRQPLPTNTWVAPGLHYPRPTGKPAARFAPYHNRVGGPALPQREPGWNVWTREQQENDGAAQLKKVASVSVSQAAAKASNSPSVPNLGVPLSEALPADVMMD